MCTILLLHVPDATEFIRHFITEVDTNGHTTSALRYTQPFTYIAAVEDLVRRKDMARSAHLPRDMQLQGVNF